MNDPDLTGVVHHIEINVSDLARSSAFWGWLLESLGYDIFQQWDSGKSWKRGDTYIVFVQTDLRFAVHPYHRCGTGLNHIAFHAASRRVVDNIVAQLPAHGGALLYKDKHPYAGGKEHYAAYFEDPDRIKIEIVAPSKSR